MGQQRCQVIGCVCFYSFLYLFSHPWFQASLVWALERARPAVRILTFAPSSIFHFSSSKSLCKHSAADCKHAEREHPPYTLNHMRRKQLRVWQKAVCEHSFLQICRVFVSENDQRQEEHDLIHLRSSFTDWPSSCVFSLLHAFACVQWIWHFASFFFFFELHLNFTLIMIKQLQDSFWINVQVRGDHVS